MKVLYLSRNDGTDMRIGKTCNSLSRLGHQVTFVGWNRTPDENRRIILDPEVSTRIFVRQAKYGQLSYHSWPSFYKHVAASLKDVHPDVIHCSNEWPAILVFPFKHIFFKHLVVDVFDSIAAQKISNPLFKAGAWFIRNGAYVVSDSIIETGIELQAMLGRFSRKSVVIMNCPYDPGEEIAASFPSSSTIQISVGGSLSKRRNGLDTLLKAVDSLPAGDVRIKASGWLMDDYAKEVFVRHPAVEYQRLDTPEESLKEAAQCDALYYLREDADDTEYRSWVMPNRLFDAMSVGRPIIMSRSTKISAWIEKQNLGFACDIGDWQHLAKLLSSLKDRRRSLPEFSRRVRDMFTSQYTWPVMEERLRILYKGLQAK